MNEVTQVILQLREKWEIKGFNTQGINHGNCDLFAQEILDQIPLGSTYWGEDLEDCFPTSIDPDGHCFFFLNGKYYDAECPEGVDSPAKLPFYETKE